MNEDTLKEIIKAQHTTLQQICDSQIDSIKQIYALNNKINSIENNINYVLLMLGNDIQQCKKQITTLKEELSVTNEKVNDIIRDL